MLLRIVRQILSYNYKSPQGLGGGYIHDSALRPNEKCLIRF